ncbi:hypothetical protein HpBT210_14660 [Helicobacter pylori]
MVKTYFKGLDDPKQRAAATRLDIATNGIKSVKILQILKLKSIFIFRMMILKGV